MEVPTDTLVTGEQAQNWLAVTGNDHIVDYCVRNFFTKPEMVPHRVVAMLCIAMSAETPQDYDKVYYAVRKWERVLFPEYEMGVGATRRGIVREAVVARGEMTEDEFDEAFIFNN